jgi:hypothetical protein
VLYSAGQLKELKGTGVWGWLKIGEGPQGRAAVAATLAALVLVIANPGFVQALNSDASINQPMDYSGR